MINIHISLIPCSPKMFARWDLNISPQGTPKRIKLSSPYTEPSHTPIFCLNDDCLAEIFTYLDISALFRIYQSHPRFKESALVRFGRAHIPSIDSDLFTGVPHHVVRVFCDTLGQKSHSMLFTGVSGVEFCRIIPHFGNLQELALVNVNIKISPEIALNIELPIGLQKLSLCDCVMDDSTALCWLPQLNASLTSLTIIGFLIKYKPLAFKGLRRLTSLSLESMLHTNANLVCSLLENNKDHLTSLTMKNDQRKSLPRYIWNLIIQMEKLQHLELGHTQILSDYGLIDSRRIGRVFPVLETLIADLNQVHLRQLLGAMSCETTLSSVSILHNCGMIDCLKRFPSLHHLKVASVNFNDAVKRREIQDLTQLRWLELAHAHVGAAGQVRGVVKALPYLQKISFNRISIKDMELLRPSQLREELIRICMEHDPPVEFECGKIEYPTYEDPWVRNGRRMMRQFFQLL